MTLRGPRLTPAMRPIGRVAALLLLALFAPAAASEAAIAMLDELELSQTGKSEGRLVMRVVISLGDVLREGEAVVGDAVVLAARIEAVTPPGEIYLSPSAWLAVNKAEVRTSPVGTFRRKRSFPVLSVMPASMC